MKVGIITYAHCFNYGGVLQAYALQTYIKELGHEVYIINYFDYLKGDLFPKIQGSNFVSKIKNALKFCFLFVPRLIKYFKFKAFIQDHFNVLYYKNSESIDNLDILIFGSDHIWSPKLNPNRNSLVYGNLDFSRYKKVITYAISAGDFNNLDLFKKNDILLKNLSYFSAISVREFWLKEFLSQYRTDVQISLDPTFLLDHKWAEIFTKRKSKDFILLFNIKNDKNCTVIAKILAKRLNKKIKAIYASTFYGKKGIYSPEQFIHLFQEAFLIITNSFHGTAFSIINRKNFYAVKTKADEKGRIHSLLSLCHLEHRLITSVPPNPNDPVDYSDTNLKDFYELQKDSKNFLLKNLK